MHREGEVGAPRVLICHHFVKALLRPNRWSEDDLAVADLAAFGFHFQRLVPIFELDEVSSVRPEGIVPEVELQSQWHDLSVWLVDLVDGVCLI